MSQTQDWPGIFKNLAEGWNWPPQVIEGLTPDQLIKLSSGSSSTPAGGAIAIAHPSQLKHFREAWMAWNSDEARYQRAEKLLKHHLE